MVKIGSVASGGVDRDQIETAAIKTTASPTASSVFSGAGLDDIIIDASAYTGPSLQLFFVWSNVTASPDQYNLKYASNSGATIQSNKDASLTPTDVLDGLKISFSAIDGHTNFDSYTITLTACGVTINDCEGDKIAKLENSGTINSEDFVIATHPSDDALVIQNTKTNTTWSDLFKYALRQLADGTLYLNTGLGKAIEFYANGSRQMRLIGGKLGLGVTNASAKLHVTQESSSGNIPCLELDQDDTDKEFIEFDGSSAADGSSSLSSSTGEAGACGGKIRITINGTTKWIRFYDDHT